MALCFRLSQTARAVFEQFLRDIQDELRHDTTHKWLSDHYGLDPRFLILDTSSRVGMYFCVSVEHTPFICYGCRDVKGRCGAAD